MVDFLTKKLDQLNEGPARLAVAYNQSAKFVQLLELFLRSWLILMEHDLTLLRRTVVVAVLWLAECAHHQEVVSSVPATFLKKISEKPAILKFALCQPNQKMSGGNSNLASYQITVTAVVVTCYIIKVGYTSNISSISITVHQ